MTYNYNTKDSESRQALSWNWELELAKKNIFLIVRVLTNEYNAPWIADRGQRVHACEIGGEHRREKRANDVRWQHPDCYRQFFCYIHVFLQVGSHNKVRVGGRSCECDAPTPGKRVGLHSVWLPGTEQEPDRAPLDTRCVLCQASGARKRIDKPATDL